MFRSQGSRCLLVACLRFTQGKSFFGSRGVEEEGCCAECHEDRSGGHLWGKPAAYTASCNEDHPHGLGWTEVSGDYHGHSSNQAWCTEKIPMTGFINVDHQNGLGWTEAAGDYIGRTYNQAWWTEKLAMTGFIHVDHAYPVSSNEEEPCCSNNNKQTEGDSSKSTEDEQEVQTDPSDNGRLKRLDWREKGAVTAVRNQMQCGCCFVISTEGSMEGLGKITTGILQQYSVQQMIDCDLKGRNDGCYGGHSEDAFQYMMEFGLTTEKLYPFTSHKKFRDEPGEYEEKQKRYRKCKSLDPASLSYISGFEHVEANGDALEAALLINPVVVRIAPNKDFDEYSGGIISTWDGPPPTDSQMSRSTFRTHSVLLVGFDETDFGDRYWIGKNSYGTKWGENGYFRLLRDVRHPWGVLGVTAWKGLYPTGFHRRPVPPSPSFFSFLSNFLGGKANSEVKKPNQGSEICCSNKVNSTQQVTLTPASLRRTRFRTLVARFCSTAERNGICSSSKYIRPQITRNGLEIALEA